MKKYLPIIGIFLICLTPLLWFKGDLIIAHGDDSLFLNPGACFNSILWSWDTFFYNLGGANNAMPLIFPISLFWHILTKLGFALFMIEKMWLVFVWLITGFSFFYLARTLGLDRIASFFSSTLYILNVFVAQQPLIYNFRLPYMILPLLIALVVKGLDHEAKKMKYAILFGIATIFMTSAWTNPPWVFPSLIVVFFYILYRIVLIRDKMQFRRMVCFVFTISILTTLLNLWWFVPNIFSFSHSLSHVSNLKINIFSSKGFYEVFRFLRSWAFGLSGFKYHEYFYENWIVILATYLIPIVVFSSLFRRKGRFKDYYFFIFLSLIAMFMTKGPLPPFGEVFNCLFYNVPGFIMFREPYTKFTPIVIFSFSILFGDSVGWIYSVIRNKFRNHYYPVLFLCLMFFIVAIAIFPIFGRSIFWESQHGWKQHKGQRSAYVDVPAYWGQAKEWAKENVQEGYVFSMPRSNGVYNWKSGMNCGDAVARYLLGSPVISCSGNFNLMLEVLSHLYGSLTRKNNNFYEILRLFNVSYVLHDKDLYSNSRWRFFDICYLPPNMMKDKLKKQNMFEESVSIGNLDFYKVKDEYFLPKIYAADNFSYIDSELRNIGLEYFKDCYQGRPAFFFKEQNAIGNMPSGLTSRISNYIIVLNDKVGFDEYVVDVVKEGEYKAFLRLNPNLTHFARPKGHDVNIGLDTLVSLGKVKTNSIDDYNYVISPDHVLISTYLDGGPNEDEYLQIKDITLEGEAVDIDITKIPFLGMCYRVEDPSVQMVQIVLGIDIDRDMIADYHIRHIFEFPSPTKYNYLYYDVCAKAKQQDQRKDVVDEYYHVVDIEMYPHKVWGADCSKKKNRYGFFFKKMHFFKFLEYDYKLRLKNRFMDKVMFLDEGLGAEIDNECLTLSFDPVNIAIYDKVEFLWQNTETNSLVDVVFVLDVDGDFVPDKGETVYTFYSLGDKVSHVINCENILLRGYDGLSQVNLLAVKWKGNSLNAVEIEKGVKRVSAYSLSGVDDYGGFLFKDHVFSLNSKKYSGECTAISFTEKKNDPIRVIVEYEGLYLKSGSNEFVNLLAENDPFIFDYMCFKKIIPSVNRGDGAPDILWEKENPTEYLVEIKNATGPFLLVFSEQFHEQWEAHYLPENEKIKTHLITNYYAQGWWIENISQDFEILIKYKSQDWTNIAWAISGMTLAGCLLILLLLCLKKQ